MLLSNLPYLDPGSGSILIQILIASLLGLGLAIRASWSRIKGFFTARTKPADEDDSDDARD